MPAGEHLYSWVSITDQRDPEHLSTPPASLNLFDFILSNCGGLVLNGAWRGHEIKTLQQ